MTIFPGSIYGGMGRLGVGKQTSAAVPWWLSGGISAANCIAAYQPKGAADLAASYVNLANPGTYNAAPGVAPTWAAADGWTFGGTNYLLCGSATLNHNDITVIVRADPADNIRRTLFTCTTTNIPRLPSFELNADNGGKGMAILEPGIWRLRNDNCHDNGEHVFAFTVNLYPTADIMYLDGTDIGGANVGETPSGLLTRANSMAIGVRTLPNTQLYKGIISALALYSPRLSAAQVAALTAAMAAL